MKPFDDTLPAEQEAKHKELIELLQRSRRNPLPGVSTEQAQIIDRVQQRLASLEYPAHQPGESGLEQAGTVKSHGLASLSAPAAILRRRLRGIHILNALAAVLVVGLLIGASLVLFRHSPQSTADGSAFGPVGKPVTIRVDSGGLEMSMSVTPGPYFLDELIAVDMSLTNHTHTTRQVAGAYTNILVCDPVLSASLTGGGSPRVNLFDSSMILPINCPHLSSGATVPLGPGQTISIREYVPLTSSGQQRLTALQGSRVSAYKSPFKDHLPSLQLNVSPHIPSNRQVLALEQHGSEVLVIAPSSIHLHFVYQYYVLCEDAHSVGQIETGSTFVWETVPANMLDKPACVDEMPLPHEQWRFAIGAPGYAIVTGNFSV